MFLINFRAFFFLTFRELPSEDQAQNKTNYTQPDSHAITTRVSSILFKHEEDDPDIPGTMAPNHVRSGNSDFPKHEKRGGNHLLPSSPVALQDILTSLSSVVHLEFHSPSNAQRQRATIIHHSGHQAGRDALVLA